MKNHFHWADWARVIGIWLVIVGHFFPGMTKSLIYSFHVPFFFVISGLLSGNTTSEKEFITKIWHGLVRPYFLICITIYIVHIITLLSGSHLFNNSFEELNPVYFLLNILLGRHGGVNMSGFGNAIGCGTMWFVYSLILVKILDFILYKYMNPATNNKYLQWGGGSILYYSCLFTIII